MWNTIIYIYIYILIEKLDSEEHIKITLKILFGMQMLQKLLYNTNMEYLIFTPAVALTSMS